MSGNITELVESPAPTAGRAAPLSAAAHAFRVSAAVGRRVVRGAARLRVPSPAHPLESVAVGPVADQQSRHKSSKPVLVKSTGAARAIHQCEESRRKLYFQD